MLSFKHTRFYTQRHVDVLMSLVVETLSWSMGDNKATHTNLATVLQREAARTKSRPKTISTDRLKMVRGATLYVRRLRKEGNRKKNTCKSSSFFYFSVITTNQV